MQNAEVMPIGSLPSHSFMSGSQQYGHGTAYLPSYLMGEPIQATPLGSRSWLGGSSPPRSGSSHQRRNFTSNTSLTSNLDTSISRDGKLPSYSPVDSRKQKPGAPPSVGLMESLTNHASPFSYNAESSQRNASLFNQSAEVGGGAASFKWSSNPTGEFDASDGFLQSSFRERQPGTGQQTTDTYRRRSDLLDHQKAEEIWVTVFGFQPGATSYILEEFAHYGNILKHVISTSGNWMYLQYQSDIQASKALSKNGKIFGGNMMIGVVPCLDRTALEPTSPQTLTVGGRDTGYMHAPRPTTMRPLVAPVKTSPADTLMSTEEPLPHKNDSFVSKAMDFVFGW